MLVSDIIDEVKEAIGKCSDAFAIKTINRAVQLLANKGLIDPLVGYFDFSVSDNYFVALPREVKTPLRVNINKSPTFSRSRIYEFHVNSMGTQTGEEPGLSWSDRGYSPIQNEKALPGKLAYKVTKDADVGKSITITGRDGEGRLHKEIITGTLDGSALSVVSFYAIISISRAETSGEAFLLCNGENIAGQYYGDETTPEYRVIKLSKNASNVRVMFRRQLFALKTLADFIPMNSELAVIQACKAVRFMATDEMDRSAAALAMAEQLFKEEQASREEHNTIADNQEIQPAIDASIFTRDGIIVADVYDVASEIFGAIGQRKIFDKITTAIEILSNRGQWDARMGWADVYSPDNRFDVTYSTPQYELTGKGHGYFVMPRHVETPIAISTNCGNTMPRNRWFEFHLNGDGGMMDRSAGGTWDDAGETCINRKWPLNPNDPPKWRRALPLQFVAIPDSAIDDGTEVRLYGMERDSEGRDIEVWRGGERGWLCPCIHDNLDPGIHAPWFTSIERITKGESKGFIRLFEVMQSLLIPEIPGTPAVPAMDVSTIVMPAPLQPPGLVLVNAVYQEAFPQSFSAPLYLSQTTQFNYHALQLYNSPYPGGQQIAIYSNDGMTTEMTLTQTDMSSCPLGALTGISITVQGFFDLLDDGAFEGPADPNAAFTLERVYSAAIPAGPVTPAVYEWVEGDMFGLWYPDEVEPKYRAIKIPNSSPKRIRIAYRKRTPKISSLTEPIPLRSRFAIEQQLRAIKNAGDPALAAQFEATALNYLRDERINLGPQGVTGMFQFDESTSPGFTGNIQ
jgi:hypothetical protein